MGCLKHLSGERTSVTARLGAAAALLCGVLGGCSLFLDSSSQQCSVNADCEHLGNHPFCQQGVCVQSNLGPEDCFFATATKQPTMQTDFLNQCTTSNFVKFDNCNRLNYKASADNGCTNGTSTLASPVAPPKGMAPPVSLPSAPTISCTDGAPPDPTDSTGVRKNVIWMFGSADFGPLMRAAQPSLTAAATPYRAVFQNNSSCNGVQAVYKATAAMADPNPGVNTNTWAFFFDANGLQQNCWISSTPGTPGTHLVDIGISDLFPGSCPTAMPPADGVVPGEYRGPVVPFVLATKAASSQQSISAEAAHLVFGNGGMPPAGSPMRPAMPWLDPSKYFIRNSGAGSTVLTSQLIGVDRAAFWGVDRGSTDAIRDGLINSADNEAAIGILSIDFYDKNRGNLKALYLQSKGQTAGYLPDSTPTTIDKINVRDGHYPLWGYVHFVVALDHPGGNPARAAANAMVLLFNVPKLDQKLVDDIILASETPQCAMKVQRTDEVGTDGGNFTLRSSNDFSCGCYFDFKTRGRTTCQACATSEDCPGQSPCNYGYCETGTN
jgi:hypothetical protein